MDLTLRSTRDAFGDAIVEVASRNTAVCALTADLADSLRLTKFKEVYPDRFFDLGVAEQNLAGISAGLALDGKIPFAASFAVFSPGRNWDQIRVSIAYNNANVKIIGGYVGFSNGKDGATHQALEDIALMRVLPNMTVIDTSDYEQTFEAVKVIADYIGPVYLRIRRDPILNINSYIQSLLDKNLPGSETLKKREKFEIGKGYLLKDGSDVTIIACGNMVSLAIDAAMQLAQKSVSVRILELPTIKPLDRDLILSCAKETCAIVTVEEHQFMGGMGSTVAEVLVQDFPVPMKIIGVNDQFGETGTSEELLKSKGLTIENIINNVKLVLNMKQHSS